MAKRLRVAANLLVNGGDARVVSHYDADGICAAGIVCRALGRAGWSYHATLARKFDAAFFDSLAAEGHALTVVADAGSGQIEDVERLPGNVIVLDHHSPKRESERVVQVNPHFFGVDGATEISASGLACLLARELDACNADLYPYALAGAIGDKQGMGGFRGLNLALLGEALASGAVAEERGMNLRGESVSQALADSVNPYFLGLAGNADVARVFVESAGLPDPEPGELTPEQGRLLCSMLTLRLLDAGVHPENISEFTAPRYACVALGTTAGELSALVNACGRLGETAVGLGVCLGDPGSIEAAQGLRSRYRARLRDGLLRLEREGARELSAIQYFHTEGVTFAGGEAGLGIQFILRKDKPVFAVSYEGDEASFSVRGTRALVARGLHLGKVCELADALGGRGGGHDVASGANVPRAREQEFLKMADEAVAVQLERAG